MRVYIPAVAVFTDPELATDRVPVPSTASDQVAPESENTDPRTILMAPDPTRVTIGAVPSSVTTVIDQLIVPVPAREIALTVISYDVESVRPESVAVVPLPTPSANVVQPVAVEIR